MDFGGLFFLALVWVLFKLISKSREQSASPPRPEEPRPGLGPLHEPPKEEGRALGTLLEELERAAQRRPASTGRPVPRRPAAARDAEERPTREAQPRVQSLEGAPRRAERVRVDQDEQAEQVIAGRVAATAARAAGRSQAEPQQLDPRLRQQPADRTATRPLTPEQLRNAVIWREILGPPLSERDR